MILHQKLQSCYEIIVLFLQSLTVHHFILLLSTLEGPPYNGPYGEAPPEKVVTFQAWEIWKVRDFNL